jgi:ribosomal protein S15P/S13E
MVKKQKEETQEVKVEVKEETKKEKKKTLAEFEKRVIELAEQGYTSEKIGEITRKEGMHSKEYGKKISQILGSRYSNPDMKNLQQKLEKLEKHVSKNKGDKRSRRDKEKISARLRRLKKYLTKKVK